MLVVLLKQAWAASPALPLSLLLDTYTVLSKQFLQLIRSSIKEL